MSTKIYDGLIATDLNPFAVHRKIRDVLEPLFHARFAAAVAQAQEHADEPYDLAFPTVRWRSERYQSLAAKKIDARATYQLCDDLYELIVKLQDDPTHTFTDLDFGYHAVLVPNGNGILIHNPLVLVFSEAAGKDYRQALIDAGVVEEYGYWDNSDAPKRLSAAEWEQRETAWDLLDVPSRDGLNITMPSQFDAWVTYAKKDKTNA